jgi:hypothetical protein
MGAGGDAVADKVLVQDMFDSMAGNVDVDAMVDRFVAEDFVEHEAIPGMDNTRDTPRQLFKMMLGAFPDFRATVHELLQDVRDTPRGTGPHVVDAAHTSR